MSEADMLTAAGWKLARNAEPAIRRHWTKDGVDWYTEAEALHEVLATQLEQMRRERDAAYVDRDFMAQTLGEMRVDLAEARATNARLHRRAQGVEAGKPEDEETIRRLRAEVRAMAKHTGTMAGHLFRAMDMVSSAHRSLRLHEQVAAGMTRERDEARAKLARIREVAARDYHETCAWALRIIDEKEGGQ